MECVTVVDRMEGYDLLLRVFIHGENHVQVPVPVLPTFFHVTFPVIGKGTSAGADQRHDKIWVYALRVETVIIIFSLIIFYFQYGCRIVAVIVSGLHSPLEAEIPWKPMNGPA